jgi:hypothetical protein
MAIGAFTVHHLAGSTLSAARLHALAHAVQPAARQRERLRLDLPGPVAPGDTTPTDLSARHSERDAMLVGSTESEQFHYKPTEP